MLRKVLLVTVCGLALSSAAAAQDMPRLEKQGTAAQLFVDDKPFLILGGELGNSTASDPAHLATHWPSLTRAGLNTVLAPVEWDQIEPQQGRFDFSVVDAVIEQARANDTKLVLLWFGAWKNSMSTYAPAWIKHDAKTYSRARDENGVAQDILSAFDKDNLDADKKAFAALLAHLKTADPHHTVVMIQVENEIGMLPSARDHSPGADKAFKTPVPQALMTALAQRKSDLTPELKAIWDANGNKTKGTWAEVFGDTPAGREVFQAWGYAVYANELTLAGKAAYPLPMYVNAALNAPGKAPGQYPSAGPLPHLFDIWKIGAPAVDMLAIDSYWPDFTGWARRFRRNDNPLFVPEANQAGRPEAAANAFFVFGELDAMGFSPFSIEDLPENDPLTGAYAVLDQLAPLMLEHQGKSGNARTMRGFKPPIAYDGTVDQTPQSFILGGYRFTVTFVDPWTPKDKQTPANHGGLIIQTGKDEFIVAGTGVTVTFVDASGKSQVGIEQVVEGGYKDGLFLEGRWLNGDQTHQGRHLRLPPGKSGIQRLKLYRYD